MILKIPILWKFYIDENEDIEFIIFLPVRNYATKDRWQNQEILQFSFTRVIRSYDRTTIVSPLLSKVWTIYRIVILKIVMQIVTWFDVNSADSHIGAKLDELRLRKRD